MYMKRANAAYGQHETHIHSLNLNVVYIVIDVYVRGTKPIRLGGWNRSHSLALSFCLYSACVQQHCIVWLSARTHLIGCDLNILCIYIYFFTVCCVGSFLASFGNRDTIWLHALCRSIVGQFIQFIFGGGVRRPEKNGFRVVRRSESVQQSPIAITISRLVRQSHFYYTTKWHCAWVCTGAQRPHRQPAHVYTQKPKCRMALALAHICVCVRYTRLCRSCIKAHRRPQNNNIYCNFL